MPTAVALAKLDQNILLMTKQLVYQLCKDYLMAAFSSGAGDGARDRARLKIKAVA